jgi:beta-lactamase regulating signal transducer with metallopeptidase domain
VDTLLSVGLGNAVLASALALLAAGVGRLARGRPALTHALWLLVLLKLLTPPLVDLHVPWPAGAEPPTTPAEPPPSPVEWDEHPAVDSAPTSDPDLPAGPVLAIAPDRAEVEPPPAAAPTRSVTCPEPPWKAAVVVAWIAGALLTWACAVRHVWRFQRSLRYARPAPGAVQARADRIGRRLGLARCPQVWFLPAPVAPMVWAGFGPARVLLPAGLWDLLSEEQRDTLLAHELAHLRRRDQWVRRLELLGLGLYWWLPVAWWARRRLHEAEELCCDAWVVWALPDSGTAYAQALVNTLRFLSQARTVLPVGASGVGPVPPLKRRLAMILNGTTPRTLSRTGLWAVVGLGALALPLLPLPGHGAPQAAPPPQPAGQGKLERPSPQDAIHAAEVEKAQAEVKLLKAQLQARLAQTRELEGRLKQAEGRLAKLNGTADQPTIVPFQNAWNREAVRWSAVPANQFVPAGPGGDIHARWGVWQNSALANQPAKARTTEQRLADLEKKLAEIAQEMQSLRREFKPQGPAAK